jgi:hypothetical protein
MTFRSGRHSRRPVAVDVPEAARARGARPRSPSRQSVAAARLYRSARRTPAVSEAPGPIAERTGGSLGENPTHRSGLRNCCSNYTGVEDCLACRWLVSPTVVTAGTLIAVVKQGTHERLVAGIRQLFRKIRAYVSQVEADVVPLRGRVHLQHIVVPTDRGSWKLAAVAGFPFWAIFLVIGMRLRITRPAPAYAPSQRTPTNFTR